MRKRLRRIHVDRRAFVWHAEICHVEGSGDCHRCIRVRVWGNGKNSQLLQADLLSLTWPSPWQACATDGAYPTSADIHAIVGYALNHGWNPGLTGGRFMLSERVHAAHFALPGFLLTDRLQTSDGADPTLRVESFYQAHQQG